MKKFYLNRKFNPNMPAFDDALPPEVQEKVNSLLAEERKKAADQLDKMKAEIDALKTRAGLSEGERNDLETRMKRIREESQTKEQQLTSELAKLRKDAEKERKTLLEEKEAFQKRFERTLIDADITRASAQYRAHNPEQVEALIRPMTVIEEAVDEEGKPTGEHVVRVNMTTTAADGKKVQLKLSVADAMKRMREDPSHANLFVTDGKGGMGTGNAAGGGKVDIRNLAKDFGAFKKARAEGKI